MKKNKKSILEDNRFIMLISVMIAILGWLVVKTAIDPNSKALKKGIPVTINVEDTALGTLGLSVIQEKTERVDVEIQGESYIVGNVTAEDISVVAQIAGISAPGIYDVKLEGVDKKKKGFDVLSIKPDTIRLKFDRLTTKVLPVELSITGLTIPDGYYLENEIINPAEVTITGPEVDVSRIYKAVVALELNETLSKTETIKGKIELRDKDGNVVDVSHINSNSTSADVTIPVLKTKQVPVTVSFLNVPKNFPVNALTYTLSNETITVAGPVDLIDNYSEINLGYVDIKDLNTQSVYAYDVNLSTGFVNIENIETVVVTFNMENMTTKKFNVDNLVVVHKPSNYDVTISTKILNNVVMIGDSDIMEEMTADDIVAEIDISNREFTTGQIKVPVTVYAPSKGLMWANGSYQAIITVKEKES